MKYLSRIISQSLQNMSASSLKTVNDSAKIKALKELLSLAVHNAKMEFQGKSTKSDKERKALENHLTITLGREPLPEELAQFRF